MIQLTYAQFIAVCNAMRSQVGSRGSIAFDINRNLLFVHQTTNIPGHWFCVAFGLVANNDNVEHWS